MPEIQTKQVLRVHVGYNYMLLDPTPANFDLAQRLIAEPCYTTVYDKDYSKSVHALTDSEKGVASYAELTSVQLVDMTAADYREAIADEPESDTQLAVAAE